MVATAEDQEMAATAEDLSDECNSRAKAEHFWATQRACVRRDIATTLSLSCRKELEKSSGAGRLVLISEI